MSKELSKTNLLRTFPNVLKTHTNLQALASVTAQELMGLYAEGDILAIYTRIDELEEDILDILARCFKIDWWDENYDVEEKRATFKECWKIKRKLGTPRASSLALQAVFKDADILEWWEYGGNPFNFKIRIDLGESLADYDKLKRVAIGLQYYKNKRSVLEIIEVEMRKQTSIYIGMALQGAGRLQIEIEGITAEDNNWLVDETNTCLIDEKGLVLFD